VDWLLQNGVLFSGVVDTYQPGAAVPTFHWWKDGKGVNYVDPMSAKAQALGATIMFKTPAKDLVIDGGRVTGIYAAKEDGSVLQINSKAVILASGGYAGNKQMMEERGWRNPVHLGFPGHDGDGLRMALAADAYDETPVLGGLALWGLTGVTDMHGPLGMLGMMIGPSGIWVNETAERYVNENCAAVHSGVAINALRSQNLSYMIIDSAILGKAELMSDGVTAALEEFVVKNPDKNIYKGDSLDSLTGNIGLDPAALAATVARYNTLCTQGKDEDFGKEAELMTALTTPPYYIMRMDFSFLTTVGAIRTNRKMQVINKSGQVIPGLYAVGTDGCELYREAYTIDKPGSANGHNVNSGRVAARNAV